MKTALRYCAAAVLVMASQSPAAIIGNGAIVVAQVNGDATGGAAGSALSANGNSVFLKEYSSAGVLAQTLALQTTGPTALVSQGTSTSELLISFNNGALAVPGYASTAGSTLSSTTSAAIARRVVGFDTATDLQTQTPSATSTSTRFSATNIRGGVINGANVYASGGNSGTILLTPDTVIQSAITNTRAIGIFNNTLYFSTGSGTQGIYGFSGTPTAAASATLVLPSGGSSPSPYQFAISPDSLTAYVADDRTLANGGGIVKLTRPDTSSAFTIAYTLSTVTGVAGSGARGLAVDFAAATLFATTTETTSNRLVSIVDTGSGATATLLATAPTNTAFRGVVFVPEPTTLGLLAGTALLALRRRK